MARSRTLSLRRTEPAATPSCCTVCGSDQVAVDEVYERGLWRLSECRRCEHQWTDGPFGGPRGPVARVLALPSEAHAAAA